MGRVPQERLNDVPPAQVKEMVEDLKQLYDMGKPKDNIELSQRIDDYFEFCGRSSIRPGVESLCLALHCSRSQFFEWARGNYCDKEKHEICERARGFISAYLEQSAVNGRINPPVGIFLMKNWCNYKDTIGLEDLTNRDNANGFDTRTLEEIASQFSGAELPPPIDLD